MGLRRRTIRKTYRKRSSIKNKGRKLGVKHADKRSRKLRRRYLKKRGGVTPNGKDAGGRGVSTTPDRGVIGTNYSVTPSPVSSIASSSGSSIKSVSGNHGVFRSNQNSPKSSDGYSNADGTRYNVDTLNPNNLNTHFEDEK